MEEVATSTPSEQEAPQGPSAVVVGVAAIDILVYAAFCRRLRGLLRR